MILYSVSMRTDIVSLFSFFPFFFSIEITLLSQLFFSFQLNDGPTTCKVHLYLRERKCTLFLDHTRDKFLHLFFNPQYSRRLAVHKQSFLNLLRQNGRRVTKVH